MLLTSKNFVFFDLTYYKNFASENGRGRVAKTHELPPPPPTTRHHVVFTPSVMNSLFSNICTRYLLYMHNEQSKEIIFT